MEKRFSRNIGSLTEDEQRELINKRVLIAGCGGLGGYIMEYLARIGISDFIVCDGDVFDETNLNRQLNSLTSTMGKLKAETAKARLLDINPNIRVVAVCGLITEENAYSLVRDRDLVIDALDNIEGRICLEHACEQANVTFIFGGVNKWFGSVCTVLPGHRTVERLYSGVPAPKSKSVMCMTVAATAAYEVGEAVKVLLGGGDLKGRMLMIDMGRNNINVMEIAK